MRFRVTIKCPIPSNKNQPWQDITYILDKIARGIENSGTLKSEEWRQGSTHIAVEVIDTEPMKSGEIAFFSEEVFRMAAAMYEQKYNTLLAWAERKRWWQFWIRSKDAKDSANQTDS